MVAARSGGMRHLVSVQGRATTQDSTYGGQSSNWTELVKLPAQIAPEGGREVYAAQQRFPEATHVLTMRYWTGILSPKHRIVLASGRILDIINVNDEEERHIQLVVTCKEGLTTG